MIARLILSLKKAAISPNSMWSGASCTGQLGTVVVSQRVVGGTERVRGGGVVVLSNFSSEGTNGLSRSDDWNRVSSQ